MYTVSAVPSAYWKNKRVLVRTDFNVPLTDDGRVADDTRIIAALPTLRLLIENGAGVCICSHLGRPNGKPNLKHSLRPVAQRLAHLLGKDVRFLTNPLETKNLEPGEVLMLQNVRFFPEEKENSTFFSALLARGCDFYVNDAFGTAHRAHASTVGAAGLLPHAAGLLLEREVSVLRGLMETPRKPLMVIVGGAKMETKIGVLERFVQTADTVVVGGGIANTFLAAQGIDVKDSLYEARELTHAQRILQLAEESDCEVIIPTDAVLASEIGADVSTRIAAVAKLNDGEKILDIGPQTLERIVAAIARSQTIVWNGPVGLVELEPFANGTRTIAQTLANSPATTILGGGDTLEVIDRFKIPQERFDHLSTGGGAMLHFLEGRELPALSVLSSSPPEREAVERLLADSPLS